MEVVVRILCKIGRAELPNIMSNDLWFARIDGQEYGPVSVQELLRMVREGIVLRDTLVRQETCEEWTRAANVEGLFPDPSFALPRQPVPCAPIAVADGRNRTAGRIARLGLWLATVLGCLVLVVLWIAVARRISEEQERQKDADRIAAAAANDAAASSVDQARAEDARRNALRTFVGHTDIVKAVAFSPDGRWLLSGGGSIHFQNDDPSETAETPEPAAPDGKREQPLDAAELEEHTGDYSVRVWDVESGRQVELLAGHLAMVTSVAFSPDGRYALSADMAGKAILWDAGQWREIRRFHGVDRERYGLGETRAINAVAFSPDGRRALLAGWGYDEARASGNYDKNPHLIPWDVERGEEITRTDPSGARRAFFERPAFVDEFHSVAFTPDGAYLVVGASGSNAGMYYYTERGQVCRAVGATPAKPDVLSGDLPDPDQLVHRPEDPVVGSSGHDSPSASFVCAALSPEGRRAVSADTLGRLCLWAFNPDSQTPEVGVDRLAQFDLGRPVRCLRFSPSGRHFATGGDDLLLWHAAGNALEIARELGPRAVGAFRAKPFHIHSLAFSPDGTCLAAGCDDHQIRLWKVP